MSLTPRRVNQYHVFLASLSARFGWGITRGAKSTGQTSKAKRRRRRG